MGRLRSGGTVMKEIEKLRQDLKLKNETPPMPTLN